MEVYKLRYPGLTPTDGGFSSVCLGDGRRVVKVVRAGLDEGRVLGKLKTLQNEYDQMRSFLGVNALESHFDLQHRQGEWFIEIGQQYVNGTPLRKSLDAKNPIQRSFFQKSLIMYQKTGLIPDLLPDIMPDLSGGVYATGKYTYRSGPNVLLTEGLPVLVDTTLNRSLRNPLVGSILRRLVARRIEWLLK